MSDIFNKKKARETLKLLLYLFSFLEKIKLILKNKMSN